ncbi:MAG TPA: hypothetical protein VHN79_12295 [Lacunisphaera sp.]|nr:hypothetical protein [Lacunisphaera sp.]
MNFSLREADVFLPADARDAEAALACVTHLCVAAHQDDIEIIAHAGICDCLEQPKTRAFGGVVVTTGAGSPYHMQPGATNRCSKSGARNSGGRRHSAATSSSSSSPTQRQCQATRT